MRAFFCSLANDLVFLLNMFDFCQINDLAEVCGDTAYGKKQRDAYISVNHLNQTRFVRQNRP